MSGSQTTDLSPLFPRRKMPTVRVPLAGGGAFDLAGERPQHFTLIVFYRGLHCPICKVQLKDLEAKIGEFAKRGVGVVAISSDAKDRGEKAKTDWGLANLRVGYGLDLTVARSWGLYISSSQGMTSAGVEEPALFLEPALYVVRADGTLYFGSVQTMPFARPHFADILSAIDYVLAKDYPARGEVMTVLSAATSQPTRASLWDPKPKESAIRLPLLSPPDLSIFAGADESKALVAASPHRSAPSRAVQTASDALPTHSENAPASATTAVDATAEFVRRAPIVVPLIGARIAREAHLVFWALLAPR
jgi:peroxiredoxin